MTRVPPWFASTVSLRGVWRTCVLEQSCFGPMDDITPGMPFHHLGVRLDTAPLTMGWQMNGERRSTDLPGDHVSIIPAGSSGKVWWNRPADFACVYFTPEMLSAALGPEFATAPVDVPAQIGLLSPTVCHLVRALQTDVAAGHPHGSMVGDSIFVSIAAVLAGVRPAIRDRHANKAVDWRVSRALDYIHAHLGDHLDLISIADAAATSPFHLSRLFRKALGCSIWQHVTQARVSTATTLMKDPSLSLAQIALDAGFESYSCFAQAFSARFEVSPSQFRRSL